MDRVIEVADRQCGHDSIVSIAVIAVNSSPNPNRRLLQRDQFANALFG